MTIIKVSVRSRSPAVADTIVATVCQDGRAEVQAVGAGAVNQAIKAIAIEHAIQFAQKSRGRTAVVLVVPVTLFVATSLRVSPLPFLISEILASNIGGAATLIGNPPNLLIGSAAGVDFLTFVAKLILWLSAITSGVVDNIPYTATMIPRNPDRRDVVNCIVDRHHRKERSATCIY